MKGQCIVAVYGSRNEAEDAYRAILGSGIPEDRIRLGEGAQPVQSHEDNPSIWEWLFGSEVPDDDRRRYGSQLSRGGTALSVLVDTSSNIHVVEELMERFHPVDLHEETVGGASISSSTASTSAAQSSQAEQVIPLPKEELKVGKRATERVSRIRTYVVEEPVQQDVRLRDERTVIEKRPASGTATGGPAEREYEIRERHEEPVVQKETRAGEELVVRKEADERTERVADKVKKTKADIKKDPR